MINESFFTFVCAGLIGLMFGTVLAFGGYRFFLALLPIWGFFFGFALGAETMHVLFGYAFLATITSWVVGFVVGAIFAVLSYLFYLFAVAIIAGSLGYVLTLGVMGLIGLEFGFITWLIGIIAALALAFVTIRFNLQKWVVIAATSVLGATTIFGTILLMFNPAAALLANPVQVLLSTSPFLLIMYAIVIALAVYVQVMANRDYEVKVYNRMSEGA